MFYICQHEICLDFVQIFLNVHHLIAFSQSTSILKDFTNLPHTCQPLSLAHPGSLWPAPDSSPHASNLPALSSASLVGLFLPWKVKMLCNGLAESAGIWELDSSKAKDLKDSKDAKLTLFCRDWKLIE